MYGWLKLLHIVAAIVAVGTNLTYFAWLRRVRRDPPGSAPIVAGIKAIDARVANPAYVVLPVTGILMVLDSDLGFSTFWIATAIGLYIAMGVIAAVGFTPALRSQVAMAEAGESGSDSYAAAVQRTTTTGIITMIPIAFILYLMVLKPDP
jgi:uncharacterized membrane protein